MLMFVRSTRALGQLTSPTGDFPKQTSLCIAALATVSDGAQTNIVAIYVAISTYRQLFEFAKLAKGLDFFSPVGSGFRQWRIGEWLA